MAEAGEENEAVRFLELEFLESKDLGALKAAGIASFCTPRPDRIFLLDRKPDGQPRLLRFDGEWSPVPLEGFHARLLVDADAGDVLVLGKGTHHNAVLLDPQGRLKRTYLFGDGVADLTFDPDGNILVLRQQPPLLMRFGPDGDRVLSDPPVEAILEATREKDAVMLLVQNDGSIWLNLAEKYDAEGKALLTLDAAAVFGAGRVSADLLGWDGIVVLGESGALTAVRGSHLRPVRLPDAVIRKVLGRPLTASLDLFTTKDEQLTLLATDRSLLLRFRILSE